MPKRKTLGQIMEDKYLACRNAGIDITKSYERSAAAVEREVLKQWGLLDEYKSIKRRCKTKKGKP